METETIASRNVVDQMFRKRFNSDICGKRVLASEEEKHDTVIPEDGAMQVVLSNDTIASPETAETSPETPTYDLDNFVLGWDCP